MRKQLKKRHAWTGDGACCTAAENDPIHFSEAECALLMLELGFKIVNKQGKQTTREELQAVIKKEQQRVN